MNFGIFEVNCFMDRGLKIGELMGLIFVIVSILKRKENLKRKNYD